MNPVLDSDAGLMASGWTGTGVEFEVEPAGLRIAGPPPSCDQRPAARDGGAPDGRSRLATVGGPGGMTARRSLAEGQRLGWGGPLRLSW